MIIVGIVSAINSSDGMQNVTIKTEEGIIRNLKVNNDAKILIGKIYQFEFDEIIGERISYKVKGYSCVDDLDLENKDLVYRKFLKSSPLDINYAKEEISKYIEKIDNKVIYEITKYLIDKYYDIFFIYPAAAKMHHAYVGGLAHHSIGMLHLADGFLNNYSYLDKNYVYAGIMLHDIGKALELTGVSNTEYTVKGQLLGHLVLGALQIEDAAKDLGYENEKEVMILEHMLISHHGIPQFGAAKKPMTPEALVLWYIDTIDSKFRVLGDELEKTESDSFTESIGVIDKGKIYKV